MSVPKPAHRFKVFCICQSSLHRQNLYSQLQKCECSKNWMRLNETCRSEISIIIIIIKHIYKEHFRRMPQMH